MNSSVKESGGASPNDLQRLAFAYQAALDKLQQAQERIALLLDEVQTLNHELSLARDSRSNELDSRLKAEEELDDTRERLRLAVEATNLALWDFKAPFESFFLTSRWGEIIEDVAVEGHWPVQDLKARLHPDDLSVIEQGINSLIKNERQRGVVEFRFKTSTGRWIWIESHGMVSGRDAQGRTVGLIGTLTDITQRKEHETRLAQALTAADRASKAKSEFLSNISHEIRTPLNALMGLNTLLLQTRLDDDQRRWLELMSQSSQSLLKLLSDLLDISRIEAGKLTLEDAPFDLGALLENIYSLFSEQARSQQVSCVKAFDDALPSWVIGDQGRLRQVCTNLLSNAVKFTPAGGTVRFEAAVRNTGDRLLLGLSVSDSGIGMSQETIQSLFRSFTQADAAISGRFGGSGLGLAICARLIGLMGGDIRVHSQLGQGSTFAVDIPIRLPAQASKPTGMRSPLMERPEAPQQLQFPGVRVLLAEDHPLNQMVMQQMIAQMGCEVTVAKDGLEVVQAWRNQPMDLILMDVEMPQQDGLAATREIRLLEQQHSRPRVPIVALTANAMAGDKERCLAAGMDIYLSKPVRREALQSVLQSLALRQRPESLSPQSPVQARSVKPYKVPADIAELLPSIVEDIQWRMRELRQAQQGRDERAAMDHAHKLLTSLGLVQAERAIRLCRGLEMAARATEWNLFSKALPLLEAEIQELLPILGAKE